MKLMLDIDISTPKETIDYRHNILVVGSCFTEHIGNSLKDLKFSVLQNPNGILFDPLSVTASLVSYMQSKQYTESDLIYLNELWQSWQHHSRFSGTNKDDVLQTINKSQQEATSFLKNADWLIITLGTAFSYRLTENGSGVANCHRAPAQNFRKHLMTVEEINTALDNCLHQLFRFNSKLRVLFTVSPVRHIRDGVIDNNRSKARLIEVVHHLVNKFDKLYYFPAYELVIDVLRDYRFFDIDLVHPNYQATQFVLKHFMETFVNEGSRALATEIQKLAIAYKHKAFNPSTEAHQKFIRSNLEKSLELSKTYPFLDFQKEIDYFSGNARI
jgi:hypothetical protein